MCNLSRKAVTAISAVAFLLMATSASAALSPGTVKKMKDKATDVVSVTISKATVTKTTIHLGYGRKEITYEAVVDGVTRSKSGTKRNDRITIQSYRMTGLRPPGPANPPELKKGWKGTIYLNKIEGEKQFRIGVYGHSFEPAGKVD